jgi:hypothetical protein
VKNSPSVASSRGARAGAPWGYRLIIAFRSWSEEMPFSDDVLNLIERHTKQYGVFCR